jgi:hypothetical protein
MQTPRAAEGIDRRKHSQQQERELVLYTGMLTEQRVPSTQKVKR